MGDQSVTNPVLCVWSIGKTLFHFPTEIHAKLISVFTPTFTLVLQSDFAVTLLCVNK